MLPTIEQKKHWEKIDKTTHQLCVLLECKPKDIEKNYLNLKKEHQMLTEKFKKQ
jgi:hypothetical protein